MNRSAIQPPVTHAPAGEEVAAAREWTDRVIDHLTGTGEGQEDPAQEVESRLSTINDHIAEAVAAVCADPGASPVLRAVFEELLRKSERALTAVESCRYGCFRDSVVELEQAADSAHAAAVADEGAAEATQERVLAAHDALHELKAVCRCEFARCDRLDGYCCQKNG